MPFQAGCSSFHLKLDRLWDARTRRGWRGGWSPRTKPGCGSVPWEPGAAAAAQHTPLALPPNGHHLLRRRLQAASTLASRAARIPRSRGTRPLEVRLRGAWTPPGGSARGTRWCLGPQDARGAHAGCQLPSGLPGARLPCPALGPVLRCPERGQEPAWGTVAERACVYARWGVGKSNKTRLASFAR